MKLTTKDVVFGVDALNRLGQQPVVASFAFRLKRFLKSLEPTLTAFNEARNELVKKLGVPIEGKPDQYRIAEDKGADFKAAIDSMLEQEIDVPDFHIDVAELEQVKISAFDVTLLEPFIKE